ncbi:hypothetical protein K523DRAFT_251954 [Schizophyllum commune Tattone D]|nr:hypothetical protein K523DRAFT_251954 [Schizophyllum commune Tattone D]
MRALNTIDPLLLHGRVVLFNRKTPAHTDRQDPMRGWAVLVALGDFSGGDVCLPDLKATLRLHPGDAIFLRGRALKHAIGDWDEGQRISIAHFTHKSTWDFYGMQCP